jgi:hypothetical protein
MEVLNKSYVPQKFCELRETPAMDNPEPSLLEIGGRCND